MARIFITGSSDGLGLMAGQLLGRDGHEVTLHARNEARAEAARRKHAAWRSAMSPRPDDPFSVGSVVPLAVNFYSDQICYCLSVAREGHPDADLWTGRESTGWGASLAYRGVRIDRNADHAALHKLPKVHPAEIKRQRRRAEVVANAPLVQGHGGGRQIYRDRDLLTGEWSTHSDRVHTWSSGRLTVSPSVGTPKLLGRP